MVREAILARNATVAGLLQSSLAELRRDKRNDSRLLLDLGFPSAKASTVTEAMVDRTGDKSLDFGFTWRIMGINFIIEIFTLKPHPGVLFFAHRKTDTIK